METLQDQINQIEEKIINMAHIQDLPHDFLRRGFEYSPVATGKAIAAHPELGDLQKAFVRAIGVFSEYKDKSAAYQMLAEQMSKAEGQIARANSACLEAEADMERNAEQYREMVKSHAFSLLSSADMESQHIDLAAINQTAAKQRLRNAGNAVSLLTFKRDGFAHIQQAIVKELSKDYYAELYSQTQEALSIFSAKFDQLKAAALLAYPEAALHETRLLNRNDDLRIKTEVVEMIESLQHYPATDYLTMLKRTILDSLSSDFEENALLAQIDAAYTSKLNEWNTTERVEEQSFAIPTARQRAQEKGAMSQAREQKFGLGAKIPPRPHGI